MFVIITDGEENSSREHSAEKVKAMIEEGKTYGWEFVFLGANIDAVATAGRFAFLPTGRWTTCRTARAQR